MPWIQAPEFDVYDGQGQRFTLRLFTLTDENGAVVPHGLGLGGKADFGDRIPVARSKQV